jgi:hypothetical protein
MTELEKMRMKGKVLCVLVLSFGAFGTLTNATSAKGSQSQEAKPMPRVFSLSAAALEELRREVAARKAKDPALERLFQSTRLKLSGSAATARKASTQQKDGGARTQPRK